MPTAVLVAQVMGAAGLAAQASDSAPGHVPTHYEITLVPSDTGAHILAEVETSWRLGSAQPVIVALDSTFRVVRVLVDGKPNTRISRTQYARGNGEVLVPHEKVSGDTLTTRIRYHGIPRGGVRAGPNQYGARSLVAEATSVDPSLWLPVPEAALRSATIAFHVQADSGGRAIANGSLIRVDTLAYGHTTWNYRLDEAIPLTALAAAAGPYAVATSGKISVWTWSRDSAFAAQGPFRRASEMFEYFTRLLGPCPYPSLAHVEAAVTAPVVPSASVTLYAEAGFRGRGLGEAVVARETARQWLRPDAPDSIAVQLGRLWEADAAGKTTSPRDIERIRGFLRAR
jgi:aminopeptidase N